jgi:hypothetical protein
MLLQASAVRAPLPIVRNIATLLVDVTSTDQVSATAGVSLRRARWQIDIGGSPEGQVRGCGQT